ncbi:MAG TPA: DUF111 family protein, partial [Bacteroidales bacterium]|nr:DUF111 family protein [Bacteroidales bacterium]
NIDDMNPEHYDYISEKLFSAGASDVFLSNIIMKKSRPGIILSVICEKNNVDALKYIIFTESTTLGIRCFSFQKETLSRTFETVQTLYGPVTFKRSFYKGKEVSFKPEYEECRKIAAETGKPLKEVYNNIISEIHNKRRNESA